ncbi:MAG: LacI family DNA-binding transcriptional regulator [Novosphingobium sp.]
MSLSDPSEKLPEQPTMHDVARLADVSIKSVSRVINSEPHVSVKLRAKVEAAIATLGYVPDQAARSLAGGRSFTIGVLFDNPSPNYTMKVQAGIYRACVEHQYHLRIDNLDSIDPATDLERQLTAVLRNGRVDGFVLTPPIADNLFVLDFLERNGVHYSRIAPFAEPDRSPGVRMDDRAAAASIADLFWSLGHRRFGLINGQKMHGAATARREGFLDRLRELDPQIEVAEAYGGFEFVLGIKAGGRLLDLDPQPTAIFATNDDSAAGAMVAIRERGLQVPAQISLCGFDDSWVATSVWPLLTTVRQPIEEMAHVAAGQAIARPPHEADGQVKTLDYELVMRDSVGPAP